MENYLVLTGIRRFQLQASSPQEAILRLKDRIRQRANERKNPEIGMSLVEALAEGRLNFLVLTASGERALAGELTGIHQNPPQARLILQFHEMLSPELNRRARMAIARSGELACLSPQE